MAPLWPSEAKSFRGRDAAVGKGQETSFEKFSDKAQLLPKSGPAGSTMAAGSLKPLLRVLQAARLCSSEFEGVNHVALRVCAEKDPGPLEVQLLFPGELVTAFMTPGGSSLAGPLLRGVLQPRHSWWRPQVWQRRWGRSWSLTKWLCFGQA